MSMTASTFSAFTSDGTSAKITDPRYWLLQAQTANKNRLKAKVKEMTSRKRFRDSPLLKFSALNTVLRGWMNYYRHSNAKEVAKNLDYWVNERLFLWLQKRHRLPARRILNGNFAYNVKCALLKDLRLFSIFCTFCKVPWILDSLCGIRIKSTSFVRITFCNMQMEVFKLCLNRPQYLVFLDNQALLVCWTLTCCRNILRMSFTSLWYGNDSFSRILQTPLTTSMDAPW